MIVLVDTCVWSLALRRSRKHVNIEEARTLDLLKGLVLDGRARMLGLVRQELLSGIQHKEQFNNILTVTRTFADTPVEVAEYELAAMAFNTCRTAGIAGNPVDLLLCAVAQSRGWAVLSTDKDFPRYQKHVPFTLLAIR